VYEQKQKDKGGAKMSILLWPPVTRTNLITRSKHGGPKTSSILVISAAISVALILLMYAGLAYTEGMTKEYSACRDKLKGFEQHGMYPSPELFQLALSYCDAK
jgi:hypothetical protein